nr:hypothetical protein [Sphingomonas sp.]
MRNIDRDRHLRFASPRANPLRDHAEHHRCIAVFDRPVPATAQPRGKVEVVNRGQQQLRLVDNLGRAPPVSALRRPKILAVDDLGETDDGVQRRLDLMDQLAQRRRVDRGARGGDGRRAQRLDAAGDAAIPGEPAVIASERRHPTDQPAPPGSADVGQRERRVAEGCAPGEGALGGAIDPL